MGHLRRHLIPVRLFLYKHSCRKRFLGRRCLDRRHHRHSECKSITNQAFAKCGEFNCEEWRRNELSCRKCYLITIHIVDNKTSQTAIIAVTAYTISLSGGRGFILTQYAWRIETGKPFVFRLRLQNNARYSCNLSSISQKHSKSAPRHIPSSWWEAEIVTNMVWTVRGRCKSERGEATHPL